MIFDRNDPATWPTFDPLIIAHDVGRSRDRSTAVVGGLSYFRPQLTGIKELIELPQGLYGSGRASALAEVDRQHENNALIVADLSNDASYGEVLYEAFGPRVIGLQISRHGDGMQFERRRVKQSAMFVYTIGRTYLLELFHNQLHNAQVKIVDCPMSRKAYAQLTDLETELRDSGTVYKCPSGQHDDLGISCAMLAWAAQHPHLRNWVNLIRPRTVRVQRAQDGWAAWV